MNDIIIIGGGISGLSVAAKLAADANVTLIEAESQTGYHASGRSAAVFLERYGNAVVRALNTASLPGLSAIPNLLKQRGMMLLGRPDQAERFAANAADFELEQISTTDAVAKVPILNPDKCAYAGWRGDVFDLDTDLLMQTYLKQARDHGATVETGARVDHIEHRDGRWLVRSGDRAWASDIVINAAGAWADDIAKMAGIPTIGLQPYRRSMARIPAPGDFNTTDWPFLDGVDDAWYAKPEAGSLIVSPSEEDPLPPQDAWADDMVLAEGLARFEEMMAYPVTRMLSNWAGLRTFAPDRALVIGPDKTAPSFIWLAGQGGYGFQTSDAAANLCAARVLARAPTLPQDVVDALDPARFA